ncbi:MAG: hypothetical protein RLZZ458_2057 [Planctomycetota bacterium]
MNSSACCRLAAVVILLFVVAAPGGLAVAAPPNIVVILADDLGWGDLHANNPERSRIPTPNMDRLAAQGLRFTDAHSSSGCCSPSRYTLLTGRYHWRTTLQSGIVPVWGQPLLAADRLNIASLARSHGYTTACIGKWHLGRNWPITPEQKKLLTGFGGKAGGGGNVTTEITDAHRAAWRDVFSQRIPGGPTERGFDLYFGTDVPNWPPYCFIENDRTVGIPSELLPAEKLAKNQASIQGPALNGWQLEGILPALTERAEKFIHTAARTEQPFLLYLPLTSPHTPLAVNAPWKGQSQLNSEYADLVMETDAAVGRILDALDAANASGNTLVLLTSDNGCAAYIGVRQLEAQGHFPSGPLRDYKASVYEGGHRVPFIIRWPGTVQPSSTCGQLVHHADLIATIAEILGAQLPDDAGEDSFSLLPILKGSDHPVRQHAVSTACNGLPSFRAGHWKYVANAEPELYKLDEDIAESQNVAARHPEQLQSMRESFEKLIRAGRSTPGVPQKNDIKVIRYPKVAGE